MNHEIKLSYSIDSINLICKNETIKYWLLGMYRMSSIKRVLKRVLIENYKIMKIEEDVKNINRT